MTDIERAFNEIYDQTYRSTLIYITAKCGNTEDIADILQETYTEVYSVLCRKGKEYIKNPPSFVAKVAKSKVYHHYSLFSRIRNNILFKEESDDAEEDEICIEELVCNKLLVKEIEGYIFAKPQITQKIFCMYFSLDMTISEISEALGVGQSYVKNRLYRTIRELREKEDLK